MLLVVFFVAAAVAQCSPSSSVYPTPPNPTIAGPGATLRSYVLLAVPFSTTSSSTQISGVRSWFPPANTVGNRPGTFTFSVALYGTLGASPPLAVATGSASGAAAGPYEVSFATPYVLAPSTTYYAAIYIYSNNVRVPSTYEDVSKEVAFAFDSASTTVGPSDCGVTINPTASAYYGQFGTPPPPPTAGSFDPTLASSWPSISFGSPDVSTNVATDFAIEPVVESITGTE